MTMQFLPEYAKIIHIAPEPRVFEIISHIKVSATFLTAYRTRIGEVIVFSRQTSLTFDRKTKQAVAVEYDYRRSVQNFAEKLKY